MARIRKFNAADLGRIRTRSRWSHANPVVAGLRELITQPLYSTVTVAANTAFPQLSTFFQAVIGAAGVTQQQTNMTQAGILPAPQKFSVRALRLAVRNDANQTDLINLLYQTWLRLYVSEKPYFLGPAFLLTAGGGAVGYAALLDTAGQGTNVFNITSNGLQDQRNIFALSRPIEVEQNEQFRLELNLGVAFNTVAAGSVPAGTGLTIVSILDGELSRGVS